MQTDHDNLTTPTKKIGVLYICTGNYRLLWKDFYSSADKFLLTDSEKHYFVFTDSDSLEFEDINPRIHRIFQPHQKWPYPTLKRFHMFLAEKGNLAKMDYLFFFNANLVFESDVFEADILPNENEKLLATLSGHFMNKTYEFCQHESNPKSTAYIPNGKAKYYFSGVLQGGITKYFLDAIDDMRMNIDIDLGNQAMARWHDESHWNKYLVGEDYIKIIPYFFTCEHSGKYKFAFIEKSTLLSGGLRELRAKK